MEMMVTKEELHTHRFLEEGVEVHNPGLYGITTTVTQVQIGKVLVNICFLI